MNFRPERANMQKLWFFVGRFAATAEKTKFYLRMIKCIYNDFEIKNNKSYETMYCDGINHEMKIEYCYFIDDNCTKFQIKKNHIMQFFEFVYCNYCKKILNILYSIFQLFTVPLYFRGSYVSNYVCNYRN